MEDWVKKVVIIGAGGFGREIAEICKVQYLHSRDVHFIGYLDDDKSLYGKEFNGDKVLGGLDHFVNPKKIHFSCGIGDPKIRKRVTERAIKLGYKPVTLIHPSVVICTGIKIGKGVVIQAGSKIAVNSIIDNYVHINFNCSIGHDVHLGEYTTISPLCAVSGFTDIGDGCFLGSGAITFPEIKIGKWSKLGAGSIATKDLKSYTVNIGSPSRLITKIDEHHAYTG